MLHEKYIQARKDNGKDVSESLDGQIDLYYRATWLAESMHKTDMEALDYMYDYFTSTIVWSVYRSVNADEDVVKAVLKKDIETFIGNCVLLANEA